MNRRQRRDEFHTTQERPVRKMVFGRWKTRRGKGVRDLVHWQ